MSVSPPLHCGGQSVWAAPSCCLVWGEEEVSGHLGRSGTSHFGWVCADIRQWVLLCVSAGVLPYFLLADPVEGDGEGEMGGGA